MTYLEHVQVLRAWEEVNGEYLDLLSRVFGLALLRLGSTSDFDKACAMTMLVENAEATATFRHAHYAPENN